MPRDGSGGYSLPAGNPVVFGTTIDPLWANITMEDIKAALTGSLPRDGQAGMTGPFRLAAGSVGAPSLSFVTDTATGVYRPAANELAISVSGTQTALFDALYNRLKNPTIVGDPGTEGTGIDVAGVVYESSLKVSDIDGTNFAQTILHRHSTVLEPLIVTARSYSNDNSHVDVPNSAGLFGVYATGWAGLNYKTFGSMSFNVDATGTVSNTSAPGRFSISTTPNGSVVPVARLSIGNAGNVTINAPSSGHPLAARWAINDGATVGGTTTNVRSDLHLGSTPESSGVLFWYERASGNAGLAQAGAPGGAKVDVLSWTANRNVTINAPTSGAGLTVISSSGASAGYLRLTESGTGYNLFRDSSSGAMFFNSDHDNVGAYKFRVTRSASLTDTLSIANAGNVTINAPSSGTALTVNGAGTSFAVDAVGNSNGYAGIIRSLNSNSGSSAFSLIQLGNDTNGAAGALELGSSASTGLGTIGANALVLRNGLTAPLGFGTGGALRMSISGAGNVTINTPSSGRTLLLGQVSGADALVIETTGYDARLRMNSTTSGDVVFGMTTFGVRDWSFGNRRSDGAFVFSNSSSSLSSPTLSIAGATGVVSINQPTSGNALSVTGANTGPSAGISQFAIKAGGAFGGGIGLSDGGGNIYGGMYCQSGVLWIGTNATSEATAIQPRLAITNVGAVTINAPSTGTALTVNGLSGQNPLAIGISEAAAVRYASFSNAGAAGGAGYSVSGGGATASLEITVSAAGRVGTSTASTFSLFTNGLSRHQISSDGFHTFITPASNGSTVTIQQPNNAVPPLALNVFSAGGGAIAYPSNSTSTTVGAAGAASALPANPAGYIRVTVGGTLYNMPYYNT